MADRPIIFSGPMVRAILDGRKSQTRRVMPDRPLISTFDGRPVAQGKDGIYRLPPTRYAVGDRLWVREAGALLKHADRHNLDTGCDDYFVHGWQHAVDGAVVGFNGHDPHDYIDDCSKWSRPSIHMPRWASRLTLIVTGVRVERLMDISAEDATAEGVFVPDAQYAQQGDRAPVLAYAALWESLYGPGSWAANPWVVALTFTTVPANIDARQEAA